ncbi:unnamed protein product, partial [Laminaria digitata]
MLAIRASRGSPQIGWKADRGALVAAWVHTARNSNKITSQAAFSAFSLPLSQSALAAPSCTARFLSTGTVRFQNSVAHVARRKGVAGLIESSWRGRVHGGHGVACSRVSDVVGLTPRVRTLTSGAVSGIFGRCAAAGAIRASGR